MWKPGRQGDQIWFETKLLELTIRKQSKAQRCIKEGINLGISYRQTYSFLVEVRFLTFPVFQIENWAFRALLPLVNSGAAQLCRVTFRREITHWISIMMILIGNSDIAKSLLVSEMYSSYCTERSFHIPKTTGIPSKKYGKCTTALPGFQFYQNIETVWNMMLSRPLTLFSSMTSAVIHVTVWDWISET